MDGEKVLRSEETVSLASRLEAIEKMVFSRDQSQGEDWEAHCKELEAKNRDLQTRNDALQRVIERYEINPHIEDQGVLSGENPDDNYQGSIARIDAVRREFVAMKKRVNDTEALEQHFRQKFEHHQEADLLMTAELDRAKRDLHMSEEKRAEMERQWLEISQDKMRADLDLRKLQLETVSVTRSRDETVKQLDVAVKELKRTSAKLEQAEALLNSQWVAEKASTALEHEALLKSRTAESHAVEYFMKGYDEVSREDVVGLVQELNLKILDIAAAVSEGVRVRAGTRPLPPVDTTQMNALSKIVGASLLGHLKDKDHSNDPTLIQLAMQVALVTLVYQICTTWPIPLLSLPKHPLWSIYERIRAHELQAIASRWRALSTKHYRGQFLDDYNDLIYSTDNKAIDIIATILLVAGGEQKQVAEEAHRLAINDLDRLWELACIFSEKVKEHVSSTDYQLFYAEPAMVYDERIMRNQGSASTPKQRISRSNPPKVLCTVELGLRGLTNPAKPGEQSDGGLKEVIMEKAVVIFESEAGALGQ